MLGLPVYFILYGLNTPLYLLSLAAIILLSIPICGHAAREHFKQKDPSPVVLDELAGYLVAMVGHAPTSTNLALAFLLFRVFDIAKFWPMSAAEQKLKGGLGIVADDLIAGLLANISLIIIIRIMAMTG